jgi:hypothetical protein
MPTARSLLALSLFVTACASSATPPPAAPRAEPTPQPPAPPAGPAITRIDGGGWPGSNTHEWGSRHYELRGEAAAREVRIHDAIDFQGVGMQPGDMAPTRHSCTPWEPLPADTEATAAAIQAWYRATQPPPPPADKRAPAGMETFTYGRGLMACG